MRSRLLRVVFGASSGCGLGRYGVVSMVLHGSLARGSGRPGDVDLAVRVRDGVDVLDGVEWEARRGLRGVGLEPDVAVISDRGPCEFVVVEVWRHGVLVYEEYRGPTWTTCSDVFWFARTSSSVRRSLGY